MLQRVAVVVGMHGAGISLAAVHLPLGDPVCCGVLELFPSGSEFEHIRGNGNLARHLGFHYDRFAAHMPRARDGGSALGPESIAQLAHQAAALWRRVVERPACVMPSVLDDPNLDRPAATETSPGAETPPEFFHRFVPRPPPAQLTRRRRPRVPDTAFFLPNRSTNFNTKNWWRWAEAPPPRGP